MIWVQFPAIALIIVLAGVRLAHHCDVLGENSGLGRSWIGVVRLAGTTSLPGLFTGFGATATHRAAGHRALRSAGSGGSPSLRSDGSVSTLLPLIALYFVAMRVIFTHEQQRRANETTSLPEIVVSLTAVRIGALDLGIGNVLGSNLFNLLILGLDDVLYRRGPLMADGGASHSISIVAIVMMNGSVKSQDTGNRSRSLLWATTREWRRDDEGRASTPTMMAWKALFLADVNGNETTADAHVKDVIAFIASLQAK